MITGNGASGFNVGLQVGLTCDGQPATALATTKPNATTMNNTRFMTSHGFGAHGKVHPGFLRHPRCDAAGECRGGT
jgi:hypothetical protein